MKAVHKYQFVSVLSLLLLAACAGSGVQFDPNKAHHGDGEFNSVKQASFFAHYEMRQRDPGDYDAWVSQGPKNIHARENLSFTDRGVAKARRLLRNAIRDLQKGNRPSQPTDNFAGKIVPTYAGDTMLHIPVQSGRDDGAVLKEISHKVAEIYTSGDHLQGDARKSFIVDALKAYEASWS